jgi:hypothetical protein
LIGMLRIAVATYLMVVTAAGPWFCCCAPVRLAAIFSSPRIEKPVTEGCPNCCTHHDQQRPQRQPADDPIKPQPNRPGCPCRGEPTQSVALPPAAEGTKHLPTTDLTERLSVIAPFTAVATVGEPGSSVLHLGGRRAHPFLTADEILRALHNLLC